jgi:hypothetical protein
LDEEDIVKKELNCDRCGAKLIEGDYYEYIGDTNLCPDCDKNHGKEWIKKMNKKSKK